MDFRVVEVGVLALEETWPLGCESLACLAWFGLACTCLAWLGQDVIGNVSNVVAREHQGKRQAKQIQREPNLKAEPNQAKLFDSNPLTTPGPGFVGVDPRTHPQLPRHYPHMMKQMYTYVYIS